MVAMVHQPMRLVPSDSRERRVFQRRETRSIALVKRLDHALAALQNPRMTVALRDVSAGGLAGISGVPISKGERISIRVPGEGIRQGWDAVGQVVRCEPSGLGYRVAVAFDPVAMAA